MTLVRSFSVLAPKGWATLGCRSFCGDLVCLAMLLGLGLGIASRAHACDAASPEVHRSGNLIWCADKAFWAEHSADVIPFYPFADALLPQIQKDFGVASSETFYVVVTTPNGGASTPTPYGPGVNITGDAFYNAAYNIKGFYAYLLITHEFVNQWASLAIGSGGWPTDWWANHRSPFPNALDPILLRELGLGPAADAQTARFVPGGDSADVQVPLFTALYDDYGGWDMLRAYFDLLRGDGIIWPNLRDPPAFTQQTAFVSGNPSRLLADYVVAYFNLVVGADVQARFDAAGVGTRPPNWDANTSFSTYELDAQEIENIAMAHCKLLNADAQAATTQQASKAMKVGNYGAVVSLFQDEGGCAAACVGECLCDAATKSCVPKYLSVAAEANQTTPTPSTDAPGAQESNASAPQGIAYYAGGCGQGPRSQNWGWTLLLGLGLLSASSARKGRRHGR